MATDIDDELHWIETAPHGELKAAWQEYCPGWHCPKKTSVQFLRLALAWKAQERVFGSLSEETLAILMPKRKVDVASKKKTDTILPGTILRRDWQGDLYEVMTLESGFAYEGTTYNSLSEIARKITGTRWSGPAFFGLRSRKKKPVPKENVLEAAE